MVENLNYTQLLYREILAILLKSWDPIGVQDIPEAQDEYDTYVIPLSKLLISNKSEHEIFEYLWWIETEYMGLSGDRSRIEAASRLLHSLLKEKRR